MHALLIVSLVLAQPAGQDDLKKQLEKEREEKNRLLVAIDVLKAEKAWDEDDINRVRELLDKHIPAKGAPDYRSPEWKQLHELSRRQLQSFSGSVNGGWHWSSTGRYLATYFATGSDRVSILDLKTGESTALTFEERGATADWSPDGRYFATSSRTSTIVWDSTTKKEIKLFTRPAPKEFVIYHHGWSPDGKLIACPVGDGTVRVFDSATGQEKLKLQTAAHSARWSGDGKRLAAVGAKGVTVFSSEGKQLYSHELKVMIPILGVVEWSPKGTWLVVAATDGLQIYDGVTGKKAWTFVPPTSSGTIIPYWCPLKFHPENENLLAWVGAPEGRPQMVSLGHFHAFWDLKAGKPIHDWNNPKESPFRNKDGIGGFLYWTPSGRLLEWPHSIIQPLEFSTWETSPPKKLATGQTKLARNEMRQVSVFTMSPTGKQVAAVLPAPYSAVRSGKGFDELVVWDATTGEETFRSRGFAVGVSENDGAKSIGWSPDGKRIVLCGGPTPGTRLKVYDAVPDADPPKKP